MSILERGKAEDLLEQTEAAYIHAVRVRDTARRNAQVAEDAVVAAAVQVERLRTHLGVKSLSRELMGDLNAQVRALEDLASEDLPTGGHDGREQGGEAGGEGQGDGETLAHAGSPDGG
jgi:hypothetical protein